MSTSERVVEMLIQEGGYRELSRPFLIGSQSFDFARALVAGGRANDLVIVIELKGDTVDDVVVRKTFALTRALDVLRSKRSVTAVLTSGQPRPETILSIRRVCRVLNVGALAASDAVGTLRDGLAVLLPIAEPPAVDMSIDWESDVRSRATDPTKDSMTDAAITAAAAGKDAVEAVLAERILMLVNAVLDDEGES
jgi:hypothetical protein